MTLTEALQKLGDENIRLQFIDDSFIGFAEKKHELQINFANEKEHKPRLAGGSKVGIVLWIDFEKWEEAVK